MVHDLIAFGLNRRILTLSLRGAARRSNPERYFRLSVGAEASWIASSASPPRNDLFGVINRNRMKQPAVYIVTNQRNGTLYTGVTSNLTARSWEHRTGFRGGFSSKYGCTLLVWYELYGTMESAILREKQIKGGSRKDKLRLIEAVNPAWRDLYPQIVA